MDFLDQENKFSFLNTNKSFYIDSDVLLTWEKGVYILHDHLHGNVPEGQEFKLENGRVLKNLYELNNALQSMEIEIFHHHVTHDRNDFANWILHVYKDEHLAHKIAKLKKPETIRKQINKILTPKLERRPLPKVTHKKAEVKSEPKKEEEKNEEKKSEKKTETKTSKKKSKKKKKSIEKSEKGLIPEHHETLEKVEVKHTVSDEQKQLLDRVDEILQKEKEIERREEKIQEIEQRIEKRLAKVEGKSTSSGSSSKFFSKEFVQGLVTGFLVTLIGFLAYVKFVT